MMVPDFKRICEIELLSVGFCDAKSMATKLVTTFRLCADLLSGQPHYDFGMRALKTVLRLSKMRKLQSFDDYESREDAIVMRAINDVNLGKLINDDVPIYQVEHMIVWNSEKINLVFFILRYSQFYPMFFRVLNCYNHQMIASLKRSRKPAKSAMFNALSISWRKSNSCIHYCEFDRDL